MIRYFKIIFMLFLCLMLLPLSTIMAQKVIQTQESDMWDGVAVDLISLKVSNNIVTVKFKIRNTGSEKQSVQIHFKDCYIVDEANQKKYYALKDSDGLFIAGPKDSDNDGGRFWFDIFPKKSKGMWIKFPEPTDNPDTITIFLPGVSPFEEVKLK
jgi:hypothetical protein